MKKIMTLIIPTYNFQDYLRTQILNFRDSKIYNLTEEIIFVNDGSTDNTGEIINDCRKEFPELSLREIHLPTNEGRYRARLQGAYAAQSEVLFFIDTSVSLQTDIDILLSELLNVSQFLMADIKISHTEKCYSLYWKRTHEKLFKKTFEQRKQSFYIDSNNFHSYLTGTGALIVPKNIFLKFAETFESNLILSDYNGLLERIVADLPLF